MTYQENEAKEVKQFRQFKPKTTLFGELGMKYLVNEFRVNNRKFHQSVHLSINRYARKKQAYKRTGQWERLSILILIVFSLLYKAQSKIIFEKYRK